MKKLKKMFESFMIVVFTVIVTGAYGYLSFFKLVPMLWHQGSSYAFQAMITVIILSTIAMIYLIGAIIGFFKDFINHFKSNPSD